MDKKQIEKLKREISSRWNRLLIDGLQSQSFYQLEYILQEAGLLAKQRQRRNKKQPELAI